MKIWILLFAIASMQFVVEAKPLKDIDLKNVDILSNIPDDIDTDKLIRILYDFMNNEVSNSKFTSEIKNPNLKILQPGSILDAPVVCNPGYRPDTNEICRPIF